MVELLREAAGTGRVRGVEVPPAGAAALEEQRPLSRAFPVEQADRVWDRLRELGGLAGLGLTWPRHATSLLLTTPSRQSPSISSGA